jgi:hypothetical protein
MWSSIVYGNNLFVAAGSYFGNISTTNNGGESGSTITGYSAIATSSDGKTWTARRTGMYSVMSLAFGNGTFVGVGYWGTSAWYSTDGTTWKTATVPDVGGWRDIAYGNGMFVAVGPSSSGIMSSSNGKAWTQGTVPAEITNGLSKIVYGNGIFLAFPYKSSDSHIAKSSDGQTWTALSKTFSGSVRAAAYGNGVFVIGTLAGNVKQWWLSDDNGNSWKEITGIADDLLAVGYGEPPAP